MKTTTHLGHKVVLSELHSYIILDALTTSMIFSTTDGSESYAYAEQNHHGKFAREGLL
jgi:hypothetical protein